MAEKDCVRDEESPFEVPSKMVLPVGDNPTGDRPQEVLSVVKRSGTQDRMNESPVVSERNCFLGSNSGVATKKPKRARVTAIEMSNSP